jgi:quercetin dioxygenase-like cupin family protein
VDLASLLPDKIRALPGTKGTPPTAGDARAMVEHRLEGRGFEIRFSAAPAGLELPLHTHETENVTVTLSGETVVITDDGEVRRGPGEWYGMEPGQRHGIRFDVDTVQIEIRFDAEI